MILDEKDLDDRLLSCPFCGGNNILVINYTAQSEPLVTYNKCKDCNVCFSNRQPKEETLEKIYKPSQYKSALTDSDELSKRLAKKLVAVIKNNKEKKLIKVADFGGGNGNLSMKISLELKKYDINSECTVIDIHDSISDNSDIKFINAHAINKIDQKYDLVLASAVLEHLKFPKDVLDKLINLMDNNGYFYARTPWDLPLSKIRKIRWPRHLYDMGADFWKVYLLNHSKIGLKVIWFRPSIIETSIKNIPQFFISFLLKLLCNVELKVKGLFSKKKLITPKFNFVGGWELLIKND